MKKFFSSKYQRYVYEIYSGSYYATSNKNVIITTLLGSCVSACLMDQSAGVVGMNHFLLPGDFRRQEMLSSPSAKYGMHAMEMLINSLMKLGAFRNNLEAKIFGGAHVLDFSNSTVADNNIMFIKAYLAMENIPVVSEDVGGNQGRKILFFSDTTNVYLKRVRKDKVYYRDKEILQKVSKATEKTGEITLFE